MDSDKKIEVIKKIVNDGENSERIVGQVHYGHQVAGFTAAGRLHMNKLFNDGNLSNRLNDCTIVVKIEDRKAQVSVVYEGITVFEFQPVDPKSCSTFEFPGVSVPQTMEW